MDLKKVLFVCLLLYYGTSANSALPVHSMAGKTNLSEQAKGIRISGTITDKDKNPPSRCEYTRYGRRRHWSDNGYGRTFLYGCAGKKFRN